VKPHVKNIRGDHSVVYRQVYHSQTGLKVLFSNVCSIVSLVSMDCFTELLMNTATCKCAELLRT
jgi:hypothetical protein